MKTPKPVCIFVVNPPVLQDSQNPLFCKNTPRRTASAKEIEECQTLGSTRLVSQVIVRKLGVNLGRGLVVLLVRVVRQREVSSLEERIQNAAFLYCQWWCRW